MPYSPEKTASEAYVENQKRAEILRYKLSDEAYAAAASNAASFQGNDQLDPTYFAAITGNGDLNPGVNPEVVAPEELAWIGVAARNITAVRAQVLSQDGYELGA